MPLPKGWTAEASQEPSGGGRQNGRADSGWLSGSAAGLFLADKGVKPSIPTPIRDSASSARERFGLGEGHHDLGMSDPFAIRRGLRIGQIVD